MGILFSRNRLTGTKCIASEFILRLENKTKLYYIDKLILQEMYHKQIFWMGSYYTPLIIWSGFYHDWL